ncbi:MAG: HPr family phosphocarrier protein [Clostridia bacterium]|nr:HPr family phosphocarrier protein [Clostridia bacterium]
MELTVKVKLGNMPTMKKVAQAAAKMSTFESLVLLRREDITVNAKSLMGLLSLGIHDGDGVTIIAHGEDEAQAVCAMADLLQNG